MAIKVNLKSLKWRVKYFLHQAKNLIPSVILCIRFPFLYPRNRFTGHNYNNWRINGLQSKLYKEHHIFRTEDHSAKGGSRFEIVENRWDNEWNHLRYGFLGCVHWLLRVLHGVPCHTELDGMPDGWRKSFGIQICKEVRHALYKSGGLKAVFRYRIMDIKEKWGALRWDDAWTTADVHKVLLKYEYISSRTCFVCGELATCHTPREYYELPYCDEHAPKNSRFLIEAGVDDYTWYGCTGNINWRDKEDREARIENYKEYLKMREEAYGQRSE